MSGIVGLFGRDGGNVDRPLLEALTASLEFRGPDGREIWAEGSAGLGHTRVLAASRSPDERQLCTLDDRLCIAADIRLDYRDELIAKINDQGRHCPGNLTDAELVLFAYDTWGDDCLGYL